MKRGDENKPMRNEPITLREAARRLEVPRYVVTVIVDTEEIPTEGSALNGRARCLTPGNYRRLEKLVAIWKRNRKPAEVALASA